MTWLPLDSPEFGPFGDWFITLLAAWALVSGVLILSGVLLDWARRVGGEPAQMDNGLIVTAVVIAAIPFVPVLLALQAVKPAIRAYYRRKSSGIPADQTA